MRDEISGGDIKDYNNDVAFEEEYQPFNLIEGFNVYCETFNLSDSSQFEITLR